MYPQKKEDGIAKTKATADIIPICTSEPPIDMMYNGRKIESKPNAIS